MKQRMESQGVPYSYLVDNIKVLLIFLVVFNHLIAFQLVKVDVVVRYVSVQEAAGCAEECEESSDSLYSWIQPDLVCIYLARQEYGL